MGYYTRSIMRLFRHGLYYIFSCLSMQFIHLSTPTIDPLHLLHLFPIPIYEHLPQKFPIFSRLLDGYNTRVGPTAYTPGWTLLPITVALIYTYYLFYIFEHIHTPRFFVRKT